MQRGEIWWANLPEPSGRRPVVIISRDSSVDNRKNIIVAEVTTTIRQIPTEIPLHKSDGVPRDCVVNLDVINTVSKERFEKKITDLSSNKLQTMDKVLKYVLDLS